ncbi:MAG: deoxyribonuclease IV [Candidatus Omnitrophica bacterium]|nr:deoxyribonuclease IV [Candidatus Omnitrophota bacterium]
MLKLGVHVSAAGKIYKSIDRAVELGCNTMQIFSRNPRQWRKTSLSEEDVGIFRKKVKEANIKTVVIHIPYLLNLATVKRSFLKATIGEFIADLVEADRLGADYLITHMGSFKGGTEEGGLLRIVQALNKILKETKGVKTKVLLENTSGSGCWLGYKFSHQEFVLERLNRPETVGICLDTAHAWAAGYKINESKGLNGLLDEIDQAVGFERVKVVHLNDTLEELGSLIDRHFGIGEGKIGRKGFNLIVNHPKLRDLSFILETPKKSDEEDAKNLKVVRSLYKHKG